MTVSEEEKEQLWSAVRSRQSAPLLKAALDRGLTEEMALLIASNRSAPPEALGLLAGDVRFRDSYKLKLALCGNPKTPQKVALALLKHLRIFNLAELTRDHRIPTVLKRKIELMLIEKIPSLPSGVKSSLAKKANSTVVIAIMEKGDALSIGTCLESPTLTEGHIIRTVNKTTARPILIKAVASHPRWSLRYDVRFALIRNFYAPMKRVSEFIRAMRTADLKFLYADPRVPSSTKPFIYRELRGRDESTEEAEEEMFELEEEEEEEEEDEG